ncbi:cupin domain-containing protein [Leucobacter sp.]
MSFSHPLVARMREDGFVTTADYVPDGDIAVDPHDDTETQVLISDPLMPGVGVDVVFALARSVPGEHHIAHFHPHGSEIYYLTKGEIEMRLGDDWFTARAGTAIFIPPGVIHETRNVTDEVCEMVVVCGGPTYASLGLEYV